MTKKIFSILTAVIICLSMAVSASAETQQYVYDPEEHLTAEEIFELNHYGATIENENGYAIIFCIISDNGGVTNAEYAEDAYFSFTDADNALVFVHNETEAVYDYYIAGDEKGIFSDDVISGMRTAYNSCNSYYDGLMKFFNSAEAAFFNVNSGSVISYGDANATVADSYADEFEKVERNLPLVVDGADIIPDDSEAALNARCEAIAAEYEMEVAIVTATDFGGKSAQEYADDFFDYNGYGWGENDDGMLVLYKPDEEGERELHITTHAKGNSVFYDSIRESIYSEMKDYLIAEDYEGAFNIYLDKAEEQLKPGVPVKWLLILMLCGATAGLIIINIIISKNTSVFSRNHAKAYIREGSMNVTGATDAFLYSFVNATPKPQNNSGSRSSTHMGSSGRSHGGTGGKF